MHILNTVLTRPYGQKSTSRYFAAMTGQSHMWGAWWFCVIDKPALRINHELCALCGCGWKGQRWRRMSGRCFSWRISSASAGWSPTQPFSDAAGPEEVLRWYRTPRVVFHKVCIHSRNDEMIFCGFQQTHTFLFRTHFTKMYRSLIENKSRLFFPPKSQIREKSFNISSWTRFIVFKIRWNNFSSGATLH